jgi:hypothetical protein
MVSSPTAELRVWWKAYAITKHCETSAVYDLGTQLVYQSWLVNPLLFTRMNHDWIAGRGPNDRACHYVDHAPFIQSVGLDVVGIF